MKIAMIGQKGIPATWGGVETHVEHLSTHLADDQGYDVLVYSRGYYVSQEASQKFAKKHPRLSIITLPTVRQKHLDAIVHTFLSTVHAMWQNVDIYHYQSVGPSLLSFLPRLFRPHAKVVTTFHSPDRLHQKWGFVARMMLTLGEWTAVTFAHSTITVSKDLQQYCTDAYNRSTRYIPNGVPVAEPKRASQISSAFGLEKDEYLLVVTRLVPHKGVHHLIQAFKRLVTDKKLVIVGGSTHTDAYVHELHRLAEGDDRILFTGYQTGRILEELFSNAYLYVQPSESEGLSVSVLEAASYGRAILSSDIPANAEIVEGKGFLFRNADVQDLYTQLMYIIHQPTRAALAGKQLRQYVQREYDWNTIASSTSKLYTELTEHEESSWVSKVLKQRPLL